jgi:hypothetical protein
MNVPRLRLACLLPILGLPLAPLAADNDPLIPAEKAAGDWIKVRQETVRLENSWQSERPLLESTVNGLKERAGALEERRDHLKAKTAKDRDELGAMQAKNKAAADDMEAVEARLQVLGRKLAELRPSLPPRLSEALEMSFRSLGGTTLSTGERMQLTMNVLNRCAQFNRIVTCGDEVLDIEGEQGPRSLEVIYWGLSRAYALDRAAGKAWYGSPRPQGWRWEPHPEAARPVTRLIAIYNDKADPDFVSVPGAVGHAGAEGAVK